MLITSCGELATKNQNNDSEFKKICIEGSGKGRIELMTNKQTFSYESQVNRKKNLFDLVLDFPVVGERQIQFSLDPAVTNREIKNSQITELLNEVLADRIDKKKVGKAVEEFFVFASDFMRFKVAGVYPKHYSSSYANGHFIMERSTPSYRFVVDNSVPNEKFFERTMFKIFVKELSNDAILTLFLVPDSCDNQ